MSDEFSPYPVNGQSSQGLANPEIGKYLLEPTQQHLFQSISTQQAPLHAAGTIS